LHDTRFSIYTVMKSVRHVSVSMMKALLTLMRTVGLKAFMSLPLPS